MITPWLEWLSGDPTTKGFLGMPILLPAVFIVPPLVAAILLWTGFKHQQRLSRLFSGEILDRVRPTSVRVRRTIRDFTLLAALTLGIIAILEPRYGKEIELIKQSGVDIALIIDLSRSMDAEDVDPSRLERARREVLDLLEVLEGDRVGLVVFAGGAYPRMPLSHDHDLMRMLITEVDTTTFSIQGSALGDAIRVGMEMLSSDESTRSGKAMVILSDGEVHDPGDALAAATEAQAAGMHLYTVGIGREPTPIPDERGNLLRDESGQIVMTRPSSEVLAEIARLSGGAYVDSVASSSDMRRLYQQEIRGSLTAGITGVTQQERWRSAYQWPLGIGVMLALFGVWLGDGRRRWGAALGLLLAVSLTPSAAIASTLAEGDSAFQAQDFYKAVRIFTALADEQPNNPDLFQRLGTARYRMGDFEGAARAFDRQAELESDAQSLFNSGTSHHMAGRLETAKERYDQVLQQEPSHKGAQANKTILEAELTKRRQFQPPPPEPEGGEQSQDGQEGEPGDPSEGSQEQQGQQGQQNQSGDQKKEGEEGEEGEKGEEGSDRDQDEKKGGGSQSQGEQKQGQDQRTGEQQTQHAGGEKQISDTQERVDDGDSQAVGLNELDDANGEQAPPSDGVPTTSGAFTAEQAERTLNGVEEGRPRITVRGEAGGKPW